MLDLSTIKTDFLFENSQDFNQTTHARPQHPIVFIHNISLYFNCISSVKYHFKWSRRGHVMPFSEVGPKHPPQKCLKHGKSTNASSQIRDFFAFFNFQNGVLWEEIWGGLRKIIFVSILHVISFYNYFKTTLRPNWLSLYLNFCSLSSTKPLLASVWRSNFYSESQNHMLAMHIIAHFFPIFWKFPEAVIMKGEQRKRRRGRRLEQRVEWRWMRSGRWSVVLWY